jgi:hypothetical protein
LGGFAKVDNRFGYGEIVTRGAFEFARVGEREDKGGV